MAYAYLPNNPPDIKIAWANDPNAIIATHFFEADAKEIPWENASAVILERLRTDRTFKAARRQFERIIAEIKPEFLKEYLPLFVKEKSAIIERFLGMVAYNSYKDALGNQFDEKLLASTVAFLDESTQAQRATAEEEMRIAKTSTAPTSPHTLDILMLAFSFIAADHEPDNAWVAIQTLQAYAAMLVVPFLLSSAIDDLFNGNPPTAKLNLFYVTILTMVGVFILLKAYKRFQSVPRTVKYLRNYTDEAREGRFEPLLCRDDVIERVFQCWRSSNRGTRQHPLLVGPPGVGKSTIFYEIARRIAFGQCPDWLKNKRMFGGSSALLLPGSSVSDSDSEDRLERVLRRLEPFKNSIILALDEVHAFMAGKHADQYGEMLKSILDTSAKGYPLIIGTTTEAEYRKYIFPDGSHVRRFNVIHLLPANKEETLVILRDMVRRFAPDLSISEEILLFVYQQTADKLKKYNQPEISKRILTSAISAIRLAQEGDLPTKKTIKDKEVTKTHLMSQYTTAETVQARDELTKKLEGINEEIEKLQKALKEEEKIKQTFDDNSAELEATQKRIDALTVQIKKMQAKGTESAKEKMLFHFLLNQRRPFLLEEQKKLEKTLGIPSLDQLLIGRIVEDFAKQTAEFEKDDKKDE